MEILIKEFPLDAHVVHEIAISTIVPTTIMFPSAPTALESAGITAKPEASAAVLLSHTPGRKFLSVRALKPDARAILNVIWNERVYILRLATSDTPCGSVTFYENKNAEHTPAATAKRVTPAALLGLIDRAKSYRLVHAQKPEAVSEVEHRAPPASENTTLYEGFSVTVEEVLRFDSEDTIVFKLRLKNTSDSEIRYDPQGLAARIGAQIYPASIADADGVVPPRATTTVHFAITGKPDGTRANLSVKNAFNIIVPRIADASSQTESP